MRKVKHRLPPTALRNTTQGISPFSPGRFNILALSLASALPVQYVWGADVVPSTNTGYIWGSNTSDPDAIISAGIPVTSSHNGVITSSFVPLGTLTNNGHIFSNSPSDAGFLNVAGVQAAEVDNNGAITGSVGGFQNNGTIGTLSNSGIITDAGAGSFGIRNDGSMTLLTNRAGGTISGKTGINNLSGTIGTLTNSGTISGSTFAIRNGGTIGMIANSGGTIAGAIINSNPTQDLNFSGGTGSTFGTLTGVSAGIGAGDIGAITNTVSNVNFVSGNQLLNDNITVTGHTVINSGSTLQINNTIAVTGNYTQNAAATLNIGVADGAVATGVVSTDSGYGRLAVSGVATFDAGSTVALKKLNSYAFAQGQRFVVVQANNGSANYNAGSLNYSATGYSGGITGASVTDTDNFTKTDLVITLTAAGSGSSVPINAATDSNASASLGGLFHYTGTNAGMLNLFNAAAATGTSGAANTAGEQLSPAATGAALVQSVQVSTQAVVDVTSAHIDAVRTGLAQASGSGNSGIATGERPGDMAVWSQAFGGQANQSDRNGASGYRAGYNGMLVGADTAINDRWRAGGLINYANTSIANTGNNTGSSGHVSSYGLTGYAGYADEKWYLDLSAGVVQQKYNTLRAVNFSGFAGGASGSFDGTQYIVSAQAGYPIKLDAITTLTPIGGLTYSRLHQDGYTETGSAAALQVGSANTSSIKSDLGTRLERVFKTPYGDMTPSAQLSWRHEYRDTGLRSVANFAADTTGSTSFTTQGAAPEKDAGVLVLGVSLARRQSLTLAAHYTLEAAGGYTAQTADIRLRYLF